MIRLIILTLLFITIPAFAAENFSDPAKTIMVEQKAPEFTLTLASNPTTGYSWFIQKYNPTLVQIVKHVYRPPISTLVGAGGIEMWTFKLKSAAFTAPHVLKIKLLYARPWDVADNAKPTVFTVTSSVMTSNAAPTSN